MTEVENTYGLITAEAMAEADYTYYSELISDLKIGQ